MKSIPILREGIPFLLISLLLFLLFFLFGSRILSLFFLFFFLFSLLFFRNPKRAPFSLEDEYLLSPADGKVIKVEKTEEKEFLKDKAEKISIFMSPFDVHVNRSPCDGIVREVIRKGGNFSPAFSQRADRNAKNLVLLEREGDPILLVQVAGLIARRIRCYVKKGDRIKKGEPFGVILFGSRVDIYLPKGYKSLVKKGEKVKAGISVIAKRGEYEKEE